MNNKIGYIRLIFVYTGIGLALIFHAVGILYAGARAGFLAGIDTFDKMADEDD
jgi:hypothetical protein